MFQFTSSICLGMDIADLFQFQATLLTNRVIYTTSHEEHVMRNSVLRRKPLDALLVFQNLLHFLRDSSQFRNIIAVLLVRDFISDLCKLNSQTVQRRKLCAVCFCCSNGNLRTGKRIKYLIRFTSNTAADHIDNRHCGDALFFCKSQCRQCISGLTGLTDNDHQCLLIE